MALTLARIVRSLAGIIALIIVVAIVLFLVGANPSNQIVSAIHDPKLAMAVNWGLAALAYLIVGHIIASLLARLTPRRRPVAV